MGACVALGVADCVGEGVAVGAGVGVGVAVAVGEGLVVVGAVVTGGVGVGVAATGEGVDVPVAGGSGESPPQPASTTAAKTTRAQLLGPRPPGIAQRVLVARPNYPIRCSSPTSAGGPRLLPV